MRKLSFSSVWTGLTVLLLVSVQLAGCPGPAPAPVEEVVTPSPISTPPPSQTTTPALEPSPLPVTPPPMPVETPTLGLPVATPSPPPEPTPEPRCRHDKMESGLSALVYTREHIKEYPPGKGSEIDVLLSRPNIPVDMRLNRALSDAEVAELEAKGMLFNRFADGSLMPQRRLPTGKYSAGALIPWELLCWFSDQDYVFDLTTFFFPGPRPK